MHAAAAVEGFQSFENPNEQVEHVLETELLSSFMDRNVAFGWLA